MRRPVNVIHTVKKYKKMKKTTARLFKHVYPLIIMLRVIRNNMRLKIRSVIRSEITDRHRHIA